MRNWNIGKMKAAMNYLMMKDEHKAGKRRAYLFCQKTKKDLQDEGTEMSK